MEPFLLYLIKSNLWLSCFVLVYYLFLRNERFFLLNRIFLSTAALAVLLLPLLDLSYTDFQLSTNRESAILVDAPTINGVVAMDESVPMNWQGLALTLLIIGSLVILTKLVLQISHIVSLIQHSKVEKRSSLFVVRSPRIKVPFSFFSYVFVNPSNSPTEMREILKHEAEHIRQQHWVDLLLSELLVLVMWYNPLVWLFGHFIRQNHEYLADEMVLRNTTNPGEYKAVLINQIFGGEVIRLGHMFSYSLNKKRFAMMTLQTSHTIKKLKFLWVIPGVIIIALACSELDEKYDKEAKQPSPTASEVTLTETETIHVVGYASEKENTYGKPDNIASSNNITNESIDFHIDSKGQTVFKIVEQMPEFPGGGLNALSIYLAQNIRYPVKAQEQNKQGKVYVQFIINSEGNVEKAHLLRSVDPLLDQEALRVIQEMPTWQPGKQKGRAVSVSYTVPINFVLQEE